MAKLRGKKGQGVLESAIVIFLMAFLLGGIINIWFWANKQIVRRQQRFNDTRVVAGTAVNDYQLRWAPVNPVYFPEELKENYVLLAGDALDNGVRINPEEPPEGGREATYAPVLITGDEEEAESEPPQG